MWKTVSILFLWLSFGVYSQDISTNEILKWEPSYELQSMFPYFISGVDKVGSPVNVFEIGRWDIRSWTEKGRDHVESLRRYTEQMFQRFHASPKILGANSTSYIIIADMEGYSLRHFTHIPSVQAIFNTARQFVAANKDKSAQVKKVFVVNSNNLFRTLFTAIRPILGSLKDIVELHGEDIQSWKYILRNDISANQLPTWLGGTASHQPLRVYGRK